MEEKKVSSMKDIVENTKDVLEPRVSPVLNIGFRGQKPADDAKCIAPSNRVSPVLKDSFRGQKPADDGKCIAPLNRGSLGVGRSSGAHVPSHHSSCLHSEGTSSQMRVKTEADLISPVSSICNGRFSSSETSYPNKKPKIIVKDERQDLEYSTEAAFATKVKTSEDTFPPNGIYGKPHPRHLAKNASAVDDHFWISNTPQPNYIWKGLFKIQMHYRGEKLIGFFDGIQAHLSTGASPRVLEAVEKIPQTFHCEIVPRLKMWPGEFSENQAAGNNIALYFFAENSKRNESSYKLLVDNMIKSDLGIRGNCNGTELLVFSSNVLPEGSRGWSNLSFIWGVFRERRVNFPERIPFYVSNSNFSPPNQFSFPSSSAMKNTCFPGQSKEISLSAGTSSIVHPKSNLFTSLACLAISSDKSLHDSKTKSSLEQKLLVPEGNPDLQPRIVKDPTRSEQLSLNAPHFGSLQREGKETKGRPDIDLNLQADEECNMKGRSECGSQGPKLTGDAGETTRRGVKYPSLLEGNWNNDDSLSLSLALPVFRKHSDVDRLYRN